MTLFNVYSLYPVEPVRGKGSYVYDAAGTEYLDLYGGHAVISVGHAHPHYVEAVSEQVAKLGFYSNSVENSLQAEFAEKLGKASGYEDYSLFLCNSGAEANEGAIKLAKIYQYKKGNTEKSEVITLTNSFHGRTLATVAATGQETFHKDFLPLTDGFLYADAGDLETIEKYIKEEKVAAIMFETVQGEGGVVPLSKEFVDGIAKLAEENDVLLVVDEVQTGNGRTGALYGYMKYGINPDIVSTAKGIGGGLPLGATMLFEKTENVYTPGSHGSTFGGNPVSCAGAISIIERLDENFLSDVEKKSQYIIEALSACEGVKSISGLGLMLGIETEKDVNEVLSYCQQNGVLPIKAKNKLRLLPPLNISFEDLEKAIDIIKKACEV